MGNSLESVKTVINIFINIFYFYLFFNQPQGWTSSLGHDVIPFFFVTKIPSHIFELYYLNDLFSCLCSSSAVWQRKSVTDGWCTFWRWGNHHHAVLILILLAVVPFLFCLLSPSFPSPPSVWLKPTSVSHINFLKKELRQRCRPFTNVSFPVCVASVLAPSNTGLTCSSAAKWLCLQEPSFSSKCCNLESHGYNSAREPVADETTWICSRSRESNVIFMSWKRGV